MGGTYCQVKAGGSAGACGISDGKDHRPACGNATRGAWIRLFGVAGAMPLPLFRKSSAFCWPARPAGWGKRIAPKSRELHGLLIYLEQGPILTPDLKDQILSFGERLSSEIVAAALERIRN